jgi:hypothetical protein
MPFAGFEPAIPASERPQTHALDPAATRIGTFTGVDIIFNDQRTELTSIDITILHD